MTTKKEDELKMLCPVCESSLYVGKSPKTDSYVFCHGCSFTVQYQHYVNFMESRPESQSVEKVIKKFDKRFPNLDTLHRNAFKEFIRNHLTKGASDERG